jgi:hypothetical protein
VLEITNLFVYIMDDDWVKLKRLVIRVGLPMFNVGVIFSYTVKNRY